MNIAFQLIYIVIVVAILYFVSNRYEYWPSVIIYTIFMGIIYPLVISGGFQSVGSFLITIIIRFIMGAIMLKILMKDFFQNSIFFFVAGIALEFILSRFVVAFILAIFITI